MEKLSNVPLHASVTATTASGLALVYCFLMLEHVSSIADLLLPVMNFS